MRRRSLVLAPLVLLPLAAKAQLSSVRVELELDTQKPRVGEAFRLSVEVVREDGGDVPHPELAAILHDSAVFELEGPSASSSQFGFHFGGRAQIRASESFTWFVTPLRPGRFELFATASDGGRAIRSRSLTLEVLPAGAAMSADSTTGKPSAAEGDVFLWAMVDKTQAYVGEQINYSLEVYERARALGLQLRTLPSFTDFWTEELPEGKVRQELIDGLGFRVHPGMRRALFPQRAGKLAVGPAQLSVGLRRRISGTPLEIEVLPLPAAGQPKDFPANNVGNFRIQAEVDKTKVKQNEPLTWSIIVQGEGNLRFVELGVLPALQGARRYEPKVGTVLETTGETDRISGRRRWEFLVLPERAGSLQLPGVSLSWFDPQKGRYLTATTEALRVDVEGVVATESIQESPPASASAGFEAEPFAAFVLGEHLPRAPSREPWLTSARWMLGMAGVPAILASFAAGKAFWRQFAASEQAKRRAQFRKRQRELLQTARASVVTGDGFHARISQLLQDLALARAGSEGMGLPRAELLELLRKRGVPAEDCQRLQDLLESCDEARFGARAATQQERQQVLDRTLGLMHSPGWERAP